MTELNRDDFTVAVGEKWFNHELQHYIDSEETLYFNDGLVIRGIYDGVNYKSARIHTKDKFYFQYGKVDMTFKVPKGKGTWPAIWLMPQESKYGHWPKSGELDMMEHVGRDLDNLFLCVHSEAHNHHNNQQYYSEYYYPGLSDDFQTLSFVWQENQIEYHLNGECIAVYKRGEDGFDPSVKGWPFDEPFYLIINMAIGGKFGGEVDSTCFPQEFIVKDIKIYQ